MNVSVFGRKMIRNFLDCNNFFVSVKKDLDVCCRGVLFHQIVFS
jgi:hypothetical protein